MRKNGFTLIELLAVIVILAIIALIATPIILGIINDAREKANERSVELYASAVRNGIAAYQLREGKEVLPGTYNETNKLPFEVEYDGKVDCTSVIISEYGKVSLDKCTVNGGEKQYSYGIEEENASLAGTIGICNPLNVQTEEVYTAGDKYECDVDPNKEGYDQIFYVLTTVTDSKATSVNLIMDSNINVSGEAIKGVELIDNGRVAWITKENYISEEIGGNEEDWDSTGNGVNDKGPIAAIEYLKNATIEWTNTNKLTINKFTACSDDGVCIEKPMKEYVVNARMPYYNEISSYSSSTSYLYDNPYSDADGYWMLSSNASNDFLAWFVGFSNEISVWPVSYTQQGVRPVINLSI